MGFLLGGPYFHLRGRTGNNVGRVVKGRNVFAMRPTPSEKPPTAAQMDQRRKFGMFTSWLSWVTPVLDFGFEAFAKDGSPYSAAVGYNLMHAVSGVSPNFSISYPDVMFSRGQRNVLEDPVMVTAAGAVINVTWDSVLLSGYAEPTDKVTFVAYNSDADRFVVVMDAALRSAEEFELQLPIIWGGDMVQLWYVVRGDGDVSNTGYVGQLSVVP